MTRFLLGALDRVGREQVLDRLEAEPTYFEAMAAAEDDLILRHHHRQLSAEDERLFAAAYSSSPARRARVDETLAVIEGAMAWKVAEAPVPASGSSRWRALTGKPRQALPWLFAPVGVSRLALASALLAVTLLAGYTGRSLRRAVPVPVTFATTLSALGERTPGRSGMDRVQIPPETNALQVSFEVDGPQRSDQLKAELEGLDGGAPPPQPTGLVIEPSAGGATVTVTVTVAAPLDGDYLLRLLRAGGRPGDLVATRAFRVKRLPRAGS